MQVEWSVECGTWQWPLWLLLVTLNLLPAMPVLLWVSRWILPVLFQEGTLDFTGIKFVSTIHRITSEPFGGSHWHWPAVLVAQRLLMVSVTVFVNDALLISVGVTLVAFFGLVVQLLAQPYRVQWVNILQAVASACLVSLTICSFASGVFIAVGFDPNNTPLRAVQDHLEICTVATAWQYTIYSGQKAKARAGG
jgi:hypothetical protein